MTWENTEPLRTWHIQLPAVPVGVNSQYRPRSRGRGELTGGLWLTREAKRIRELLRLQANALRFTPRLDRSYRVRITYVVPSWHHDIDGPVKGTLDALFWFSRPGDRDHRIVRLEVTKCVNPSNPYWTDIWIDELP